MQGDLDMVEKVSPATLPIGGLISKESFHFPKSKIFPLRDDL